MTHSYLATIQYWGQGYFGWQKQPEHPSIQQTLEEILELITKSKDLKTKASGRTDAGVHALGQVVRMDITHDIPCENLMKACNNLLPDEIKIVSLETCSPDFCPQRHAVSKEYHYNFCLKDSLSNIFQDLYVYKVREHLDIELMQKACQLFIGIHDFSHFYCEGTPVKSYVREIFSCEIIEMTRNNDTHYFSLVISGSGFLKQMVRLIMGAIWAVGAKKLELSELELAISNPSAVSKRHLAALAPSKGLLLHHVSYDKARLSN